MANRLINEQSPYLLQHAHNPVDWYPWGDEAFERAAKEHKPLIISIGYAACHWCHVMEHESFEDEDTAAYMNEHFVCVKVDREEHPDVDHMYMDAVQAIAGNGGWPLNVFVSPGRAPFYGGTYYPSRPAYSRPSWMQILHRMNEIWTSQQDEVMAQGDQLLKHLRQASQRITVQATDKLDESVLRKITDNLLKQGDKQWGGFGNAPKFPGTMAVSFLLEYFHYTGYKPALDHALLSLDCMIAGGIYDQIGGGFSRYSTDREWLAPHFEKMLYDNALLIMALCDGFMTNGSVHYKRIIEETVCFVERELKDKSGGYYCALDADSEGAEGKFYTWTWDEWIEALGENDVVAEQYFGIKRAGNWEGTNILHIAKTQEAIALDSGLSVDEVQMRINSVKGLLLNRRAARQRPQTDDKCLLSWNALMNTALTKAGITLFTSDQQLAEGYLRRAEEHMVWMLGAFDTDGGLLHTWKNGVARIPAKLDDFAYLVDALLQLGSGAGNPEYILEAASLMEDVCRDFGEVSGYFYYTSAGQRDIPVRKIDTYDGAQPSANAVMARNLLTCGLYMGRTDWTERGEMMIYNLSDTISRYSYSFGYWAMMLQRQLKGMKTIICSGKGAEVEMRKLQSNWLPEAYLIILDKEISEVPVLENKYFDGKMSIFVCSGHTCLSPVSSASEALQQITV